MCECVCVCVFVCVLFTFYVQYIQCSSNMIIIVTHRLFVWVCFLVKVNVL